MTSTRFVFHFFEIMIFRTVKGLKRQKIVQNKKNNYTCHASYLRSSYAYDHGLIISAGVFFIFLELGFFLAFSVGGWL